MLIEIPYGHDLINFEVADRNLMKVAEPPRSGQRCHDERDEMRRSIAECIGTKPLEKVLEGSTSVAIIVTDHTRPTPSDIVVEVLLEYIEGSDVPVDAVTVVFATGLHRATTPEEMKSILGPSVFNEVRCVSHSATADDLVSFGTTSRGTPILINHNIAEADVVLSVNLIEPHQLAGWSAGGKNIMPGVSGKESIEKNHVLGHGNKLGIIEGNKMREDVEEIANLVGVDFVCYVVLDAGRIAKAFSGDMIRAHRAGAEFAEKTVLVKVPEMADVVIAGNGAPRDADLWQLIGKTFTRVEHVLRPEGRLVAVAELGSGYGHNEFERVMSQIDFGQPLSTLKERVFSVSDSPIINMKAIMAGNASVNLVCSKAGAVALSRLPFNFYPPTRANDALRDALHRLGDEARVLVVPEAANVLLRVER